MPGFSVVGLADASLQEARERVRGAIRNSGLVFPPRRITVNLAPADLRKTGASLDAAIAVAILLGSEQARADGAWALIGELSLGGELRRVPGILSMVAALAETRRRARRRPGGGGGRGRSRRADRGSRRGEPGRRRRGDPIGTGGARDGRIRPGSTSAERTRAADPGRSAPSTAGGSDRRLPTCRISPTSVGRPSPAGRSRSPSTGGHGLLLVGPPGSGKTLLARTIPGLLPPLDRDDALTATAIRSAAGEGPIVELDRRRPFRSPHHTISYAGMVGGGPVLAPGEVTRAHQGVLFLDELPEFGRDVLEALRQPLEEGRVAIVRAARSIILPARFQLVAAMNPCPCGGAVGLEPVCRCRPGVPERYAARVSGPLRDRIDLWVEMPRVPPATLVGETSAESSAVVATRIEAIRRMQHDRQGGLNAGLSGNKLRAACRLGARERARVVVLADGLELSARGVERLLRAARTIADLEASEIVGTGHLDEAGRFRALGSRSMQPLAV